MKNHSKESLEEKVDKAYCGPKEPLFEMAGYCLPGDNRCPYYVSNKYKTGDYCTYYTKRKSNDKR